MGGQQKGLTPGPGHWWQIWTPPKRIGQSFPCKGVGSEAEAPDPRAQQSWVGNPLEEADAAPGLGAPPPGGPRERRRRPEASHLGGAGPPEDAALAAVAEQYRGAQEAAAFLSTVGAPPASQEWG